MSRGQSLLQNVPSIASIENTERNPRQKSEALVKVLEQLDESYISKEYTDKEGGLAVLSREDQDRKPSSSQTVNSMLNNALLMSQKESDSCESNQNPALLGRTPDKEGGSSRQSELY